MTMNVDTITIEDAQDIMWGELSNYIEIQDISDHRWYTRQLVVFTDPDLKLKGFYYLRPKTEDQEDQDRFEDDPVPLYDVQAEEVIVIEYSVVQ